MKIAKKYQTEQETKAEVYIYIYISAQYLETCLLNAIAISTVPSYKAAPS